MGTAINPHSAVCLTLTRAISSTRTVDEIYSAALDALAVGLGVERSSILLFDPDGVMRFKAHRGLSDGYRAAVEGPLNCRLATVGACVYYVLKALGGADLPANAGAYRPLRIVVRAGSILAPDHPHAVC